MRTIAWFHRRRHDSPKTQPELALLTRGETELETGGAAVDLSAWEAIFETPKGLESPNKAPGPISSEGSNMAEPEPLPEGISDPNDATQLIEALKRAEGDELLALCQAQGRLGDEQAVEPMVQIMVSQPWPKKVFDTILESLRKISNEAYHQGVRELIGLFKKEALTTADLEMHNLVEFQIHQLPPEIVGAQYEQLALFDDAIDWYTRHGMVQEAADLRRKVISGKAGASDTDRVDRFVNTLDRIMVWKEKGMLTDEEFEKAKRKLLE